ncbi:ATP-binding protein [Archangium sp.]|uniref:ATP-binding protein n=1 Tax=Archangium sp. TaxID=1872627 RepID=UPI00286C5061|nr:ATP-binding protein [Archangium sp.]
MKYAGGLVKHLGLQMYSGAVPALSELIANAWDADARNVWLEVPFDEVINDDSVIEVTDDGHGMTFEQINERYLMLGRDRRADGGDRTEGGRKVLGRKGIGKLAGFGIASLMEIWTVRDGHLTAFELDYEKITRSNKADMVEQYAPRILIDRKVANSDPLQKGTRVTLRRLQLVRSIPEEAFRRGMLRRFGLLSGKFKVHLNQKELKKDEVELQFRFPKDKDLETTNLPGAGPIKWWIGFSEKPIKHDDGRGISVLSRGKLVQSPFYFELSGGTQGQMGLQYLTGEVHADFLDEHQDLIATDRSSVRWEDPRAEPLLLWGQEKLRELLRQWSTDRTDANLAKLRDTKPYLERVERFPPRERQELTQAITRLASIETIEDDRLSELVDFLIKAYENDHVMQLIRSLNAADAKSMAAVMEVVAEWDVLEAIATAQVVRGRVELIRRFRRLIEEHAPEKPVMQDFLKEHPWLIDPAWQVLYHERALDTVLAKKWNVEGELGPDGLRRLDFFCLADSSRAVVVEVKRPGDLVGRTELRQVQDYVHYLQKYSAGSNEPGRTRIVEGVLVYSRLDEEAVTLKQSLAHEGIYVRSWDNLLQMAETLHREFLRVVKGRAPADDPRVKDLDDET